MTKPAPAQLTASIDQARYADGWRRGKPEEDPEKTKKWGWISAKPSEFLIRMRGGSVVSAGQGATVFKWPWDSIAIVPTTVQRLHFVADQITKEKVGVKVTGIAVYRIVEPLIASRMLNFSYPERAQEKLAEMMEEMCVGASRRLIANLSVEQCLTQRKDALSVELVREIAPVVSGEGRLEDATDRGWGVIVDTIEIQDVRVLSGQVFQNMQAKFRLSQEQVAREAELSKERAIRTDETATEREVELNKVSAATEIRRQKQTAEEAARLEKLTSDAKIEEAKLAQERATRAAQIAAEREFQLQKIHAEQEVRMRRQAAEEAAALEKLQAEQRAALQKLAAEMQLQQEKLRAAVEEAQIAAQAEQAKHQARLASEAQLEELTRAQALAAEARRQLAEIETRTVELEVQKQQLLGSLEMERAAKLRQIENNLSPEVIQLAIANKLPELAAAFQQNMGEVHVTAVDGANPFGYIAAAVEGVMGLARSAGLDIKKPQ
jgi:regulator of protease activity HflC (stomatin/prohibitin superfamily)